MELSGVTFMPSAAEPTALSSPLNSSKVDMSIVGVPSVQFFILMATMPQSFLISYPPTAFVLVLQISCIVAASYISTHALAKYPSTPEAPAVSYSQHPIRRVFSSASTSSGHDDGVDLTSQ